MLESDPRNTKISERFTTSFLRLNACIVQNFKVLHYGLAYIEIGLAVFQDRVSLDLKNPNIDIDVLFEKQELLHEVGIIFRTMSVQRYAYEEAYVNCNEKYKNIKTNAEAFELLTTLTDIFEKAKLVAYQSKYVEHRLGLVPFIHNGKEAVILDESLFTETIYEEEAKYFV
jgi:hypothetical protein